MRNLSIWILLGTVTLGCGEPPPAEPEPTDALPQTTLPIPAGSTTRAGEAEAPLPVSWEVPASWEVQQPSSGMRLAQYRVPGAAGDGECVVFYFGPGQGGDPTANVARWAGQFTQPDGRDSREVTKIEELEGAAMRTYVVEITGTYDGGMTMMRAPAETMHEHMLLGGIAQGPDAPWFFKLTGPEKTLRAQKDAFVGMLRSLKET